jgi:hypothetical protein
MMAKPPYITDDQRKHMLKATRGYSKFKERDCALLITLYGTALALTELAQLKVSDYITAVGKVRKESELRAEISTSGCGGWVIPWPQWTNTWPGGYSIATALPPSRAHTVG